MNSLSHKSQITLFSDVYMYMYANVKNKSHQLLFWPELKNRVT